MSEPVVFQCLKCGYCCSHLINEIPPYGKLSLFLLPEEIHWFPHDRIVPLYGSGLKGRSRPRPTVIYAFQLDMMKCPWLENNRCLIYRNRPMTCKAFPIELDGIQSACRFVKMSGSENLKILTGTIKKEIQTVQELFNYILRFSSGNLWCWPLDKRKWIKMDLQKGPPRFVLKTKEHENPSTVTT